MLSFDRLSEGDTPADMRPTIIDPIGSYIYNSRVAGIDDATIISALRATASTDSPCSASSGGCTESAISAGFQSADDVRSGRAVWGKSYTVEATAARAYIDNSLKVGKPINTIIATMRMQQVTGQTTQYTEQAISVALQFLLAAQAAVTPPPGSKDDGSSPQASTWATVLVVAVSLAMVVGGAFFITRKPKSEKLRGMGGTDEPRPSGREHAVMVRKRPDGTSIWKWIVKYSYGQHGAPPSPSWTWELRNASGRVIDSASRMRDLAT